MRRSVNKIYQSINLLESRNLRVNMSNKVFIFQYPCLTDVEKIFEEKLFVHICVDNLC